MLDNIKESDGRNDGTFGLIVDSTQNQPVGGDGLVEGNGIERTWRDATCGLIYSGTSDIQRNLIARMMGL